MLTADGFTQNNREYSTDLPSGTYLAPRFSQWGKPRVTTPRSKARAAAMARRLWDLSVV